MTPRAVCLDGRDKTVPTTQIILPYTSETDFDRDVIITVNATGLVPSDIMVVTD